MTICIRDKTYVYIKKKREKNSFFAIRKHMLSLDGMEKTKKKQKKRRFVQGKEKRSSVVVSRATKKTTKTQKRSSQTRRGKKGEKESRYACLSSSRRRRHGRRRIRILSNKTISPALLCSKRLCICHFRQRFRSPICRREICD